MHAILWPIECYNYIHSYSNCVGGSGICAAVSALSLDRNFHKEIRSS